MSAVTDYIDAHFEETLARLARWAAQPSISTERRGVREMAALVREDLERSGFAVEVHETDGEPIVLATAGPERAPTILIYNHYDVQPEGDPQAWTSPPFEPQVREGKMYGRGVADTKSNVISRLATFDAIRAVQGELPVRVVWVLEGEEEIGSPNLEKFVLEHGEELRADGCIWEFGTHTWDGQPVVHLGLKGMLSIELTARNGKRDLHSGVAAYVESAVWRLVWALSKIQTPDHKVHIPGFYEAVTVPTPSQEALIQSLPDETAQDRENWGINGFLEGMTGHQVHHAAAFHPTANIQGIEAGYNGPGSKTILPNEARAKLDLRLVPDQDPEEVLQSLRAYLRYEGFPDIEVERIPNEGDLYPAISDPSAPFIQQVVQSCRDVAGTEPVVVPSNSGSGPMSVFSMPAPRGLGLPTACIGTGYPDSRAHAPDENIRLEDMRRHMHTMSRLVELLVGGR
ncbi:MAG: M20/M25/M40 family metallo-hydrolase [Chloroflexota bacterium]|nr:M20/M25/M40 family metallo-hydrolase [Chloroflexota bacterium]MDQ5866079.1 M20/M25/M40 family metallo-hydrolase [Chloroflexota bacterium]